MKRRHRLYVFVLVATALAACGLDLTGSPSLVLAPPPDGATVEASLPQADLDSAPVEASCGSLSDPENCGECGRSCRGSACSNGMCVPEVLTDQLKGPIAVAVGAAGIFVAENAGGRILRVADGGPELVYDTKQAPTTLVLANGRLYWGQQALFRTTFIDGGGEHNVSIAGVNGILVESSDVYFTSSAGAVEHRDPTLGAAGIPNPTIATDASPPLGLAGNQTDLYWAASLGTANGEIGHARRDASASDRLVVGENAPKAIRQHDTRVFWTTLGAIRYFDNDGGVAAATLYGLEQDPRALAKSGAQLYWLSATTGDLRRGEMDGTRVVTLATGEPYTVDLPITNGIALDDEYVYWITNNNKLKRVPK